MRVFSRSDKSILGNWWWTIDLGLFSAFLFLFLLGIYLNLSSSPAVAQKIGLTQFFFFKRHLLYSILALFIFSIFSFVPQKYLLKISIICFVISCFCLFLVPIIGIEVKGARRWLSILGFTFQPSEFIKPFYIIFVAWVFSRSFEYTKQYKVLFVHFVIIAFLILQPDIGTLFLITSTILCQYFVAGLSLLFVSFLCFLSLLLIIICYFVFPHISSRIDHFFAGTFSERYSTDYQIIQSLDAFKSGGLWGVGSGAGIIKKNIPDVHADFIMASVGEEFGLFVVIFIVLIYFLIFFLVFKKLIIMKNRFSYIALSGLISIFILQALINIGSTINLLPTKGLTLPLISYGGSSLISSIIIVAWILNLTKKKNE